jgi:hypothetical protein
METSAPIESPQRIVKAWSHTVIGNVTLMAMLTLVMLGLFFNVRLSTSSALALGAFAGFVVAAINWFRLGRRWKGLVHLLISPAIYLMIPVGIPLVLTTIITLLSGGSAERAVEIGRSINSALILALYFGAAFLIIAYLYSMTKRDIAQLQTKGVTVEYADFLPPMGIAALGVMLMWGVATVAGQAYVASVQNHVYCELLKPGMSEEEVSQAMNEVGPHLEARLDGYFPLPEGVAYYRNIRWRDHRFELNYDLSLWVGYDANGELVWRGREWADLSGGSLQSGVDTIQCPWTFSQSVTAR